MKGRIPVCPICGTKTEYKARIVASNGRVVAPEEVYCKTCKKVL